MFSDATKVAQHAKEEVAVLTLSEHSRTLKGWRLSIMNIKTKQQYFFKKPTAPKTVSRMLILQYAENTKQVPDSGTCFVRIYYISFGLSARSSRYLAYKIREIRGKQLYGDCKQDYSEELACEVYTALTKQPYKERCST